MTDIVDRILSTYKRRRPLVADRVEASRPKIAGYIDSLTSAGQRDVRKLTIYGLAYLEELFEGRDPRFTGC
jgi:hypothetical protein